MNTTRRAIIVFCSLCVVIGIIGGIYGISGNIIKANRLRKDGQVTYATVTDLISGENSCADYRKVKVVYVYTVEGIKFKKDDYSLVEFSLGDTLLVVYWKNDPNVHRIVFKE